MAHKEEQPSMKEANFSGVKKLYRPEDEITISVTVNGVVQEGDCVVLYKYPWRQSTGNEEFNLNPNSWPIVPQGSSERYLIDLKIPTLRNLDENSHNSFQFVYKTGDAIPKVIGQSNLFEINNKEANDEDEEEQDRAIFLHVKEAYNPGETATFSVIVFGPVLKEDNVILYKYPWQDSNDGKSEAEELHRWPIKPQQNSTKYEFSISIPFYPELKKCVDKRFQFVYMTTHTSHPEVIGESHVFTIGDSEENA